MSETRLSGSRRHPAARSPRRRAVRSRCGSQYRARGASARGGRPSRSSGCTRGTEPRGGSPGNIRVPTSLLGMCAAMAITGTRLRWQSYRPLMRCRLPGPQLPAQAASSPVRCARPGRERGRLLVPDVDPTYVLPLADRVGDPVEGVAANRTRGGRRPATSVSTTSSATFSLRHVFPLRSRATEPCGGSSVIELLYHFLPARRTTSERRSDSFATRANNGTAFRLRFLQRHTICLFPGRGVR